MIIPVHTSHYRMLFRNLLYTGVTRGKKLVILLGTKKALFIAVKTDHAQARYTGLKSLILKNF
ncbi:MAG: ATP-binding domain-containing protein [Pseudobdellovibrionaceae bacterium]